MTATGVNRAYDGTTQAPVTLSDDRVSGDTLTDSYASAIFSSKNAGTGLAIAVSGISISGSSAGNYTLGSTTGSTTANIAKRSLTVTATAQNKPWDGGAAATVTLSDNRVSGDSLTDAYQSATFASSNAGTGIGVTVAGISISGPDAPNYSLAATSASATANITPAATSTGVSGSPNPSASGQAVTFLASVSSSNGSPGGTVQFVVDGANFGAPVTVVPGGGNSASAQSGSTSVLSAGAHSVTATFVSTNPNLGGSGSPTLSQTVTSLGTTTLTVGVTANNKPYDATTTATIASCVLTGVLPADAGNVTCSATGAFSDPIAGNGKSVTAAVTLGGTAASHYSAPATATTTANITPRTITGSFTAANKLYDGTTTAAISPSLSGVLPGDTANVSLTGMATFADKKAGNGKTVSGVAFALAGSASGNYSLQSSTLSSTANITRASLTVIAAGIDKTYDGTTAATVTLSDNRIAGDSLTDSYVSAPLRQPFRGSGDRDRRQRCVDLGERFGQLHAEFDVRCRHGQHRAAHPNGERRGHQQDLRRNRGGHCDTVR